MAEEEIIIKCPYCHIELELDDKDKKTGIFKCPNCLKTVDLTKNEIKISVFCTMCKKRIINFNNDLLCSITNKKPTFNILCSYFILDESSYWNQIEEYKDFIRDPEREKSINTKKEFGYAHIQKNRTYTKTLAMVGFFIGWIIVYQLPNLGGIFSTLLGPFLLAGLSAFFGFLIDTIREK